MVAIGARLVAVVGVTIVGVTTGVALGKELCHILAELGHFSRHGLIRVGYGN